MIGKENPLVSAGIDGLRALYDARAVTPEEVLDAHLDRIARLNPGLNAIVALDEAGARRAAAGSAERWRARAPLSALDGAPIVVKANIAVAGLAWTAALEAFRDRIASSDATTVARLRASGAIVVGVANMHEAALGATTQSEIYGRAFNPLYSGFTPGGSSGGSAAAVAAGFAAGALGTDTMGSVRIPSAYCGVAGFKPSFGRLSRSGVELLSWSLDHVGMHARSVSDLGLMLDVLEGTDPDDVETYDAQEDGRFAGLSGLRIGAWGTFETVACAPEVAAAFTEAIARLSAAGATVQAIDPDAADLARLRRRALLVCEAEAGVLWGEALASSPTGFSSELRALLAYGAAQSAGRLAQAYAEVRAARAFAARLFRNFDIMLLPAAPQRAFAWIDPVPANQADLTVLANAAGLPAAVIPIGHPEWPSGLQILARRGGDRAALAAAAAFEEILVPLA
jgi:aspartyl-tRNA(Asn)/glutamyl-tRNA(Gln) amidotransferase subunit A